MSKFFEYIAICSEDCFKFIRQSGYVTKHEFIFSDQRRHRIARHVAFWIVWWLSYFLLFHLPLHEFLGWGFSANANPDTFQSIQKIGLPLVIVKTMIFNSLLAVVLPQVIFTYVLINWILPGYFYKKKNFFVTACIFIAVLVIYYFVAGQFKRFAGYGDYFLGLRKDPPTIHYTFIVGTWSAAREQLSSLPIVAGLAVMIKLIKRWWRKQKETEQLANEKARAELQLLKAQIHPHFLFNTLNNIYFFTLTNSTQAPEMIKKLSGMLHYILNECRQSLVPLDKEIKMIRDYMALEEIRYGEQMKMTIEIQENPPPLKGEAGWGLIAPLLLIPFIENSFKHGASKMLTHPYVKLRITVENNMLHFFIMNSRPQTPEPSSAKGNIGLKNVKKRLQLLYPAAHELNIVSEPESFTVYLKIQLKEMTTPSVDNEEIKPIAEYAMA